MTNMVEILKQVKTGELVLIDELCAGTDLTKAQRLPCQYWNTCTNAACLQ